MAGGSASALQRAATFLRLPSCPDRPPDVLAGGSGVRCPATGAEFLVRDGVLDLLPEDGPRTFSQRALDTTATAWLYDRLREGLLTFVGLPDLAGEVADVQARLAIQPGDVVLDLACGHGNFTVELARLAGADGLVIGLDISWAMLARAATRVARSELRNVLLIHGDAQQLPLADASIRQVNCSGGFHSFPDLPRALREIARVSTAVAVLTASTFAEDPTHPHPALREWLRRRLGLHFVPLAWLGEELEALGYRDYQWRAPKAGFGYASAVRGSS